MKIITITAVNEDSEVLDRQIVNVPDDCTSIAFWPVNDATTFRGNEEMLVIGEAL